MNYEKNSYFFRKISSKMLWKSKDINMFKKKFLSVLSLILISVSLFGKTLLPAERFSHYGEENPLENTAVERIYKVKPDISFQELIATGAEYTVVLYDGNTKVMEFPNVVYHWFGMSGWNGLITEKDLSVVTSDGIHYVVKAELFSSIVVHPLPYTTIILCVFPLYNKKVILIINRIKHWDTFGEIPKTILMLLTKKKPQLCGFYFFQIWSPNFILISCLLL